MEKNYIKAGHTICNADPQICIDEVEKFIKNKKNATTIYNTTPVIVGVTHNRQAQINVMTSCLIQWETTIEEFRSFRTRLELTSK